MLTGYDIEDKALWLGAMYRRTNYLLEAQEKSYSLDKRKEDFYQMYLRNTQYLIGKYGYRQLSFDDYCKENNW